MVIITIPILLKKSEFNLELVNSKELNFQNFIDVEAKLKLLNPQIQIFYIDIPMKGELEKPDMNNRKVDESNNHQLELIAVIELLQKDGEIC